MKSTDNGTDFGRRFVLLQAPRLNAATIGVLLMVGVHLLICVLFWREGPELIAAIFYQWGGLSWEGAASGRVWQLVTHAFLHGNSLHLGINAFLFYYAAARLSHFLSSRRIFALFLFCAVGSGLTHLMAQAIFPSLPVLVGASGGITGMLLGYFSISPQSRMMLLKVSAGNLCKGVLIASAFLFLVSPDLDLPVVSNAGRLLEQIFGPALFRAAHLVHFSGGVMGWFLIGRFLPRLLNRHDLIRMRLEGEVRSASR